MFRHEIKEPHNDQSSFDHTRLAMLLDFVGVNLQEIADEGLNNMRVEALDIP